MNITTVEILEALQHKTLKVVERESTRFKGETYVAICDELGLIEVASTMEDAEKRIQEVKEKFGW